MLGAIAESGHGSYFYIEDPAAIAPTFADCLGGLLSVIAQEISVVLRPLDPAITINKVHTNYKTTTSSSPSSSSGSSETTVTVTVFFDDLQSEESRDLLCELTVDKINEERKERIPILEAELHYLHSINNVHVTTSITADLTRPNSSSPTLLEMKVNQEIDKQRNRLYVVDVIAQANESANRLDLPKARADIEAAIKVVEGSPSGGEQMCRNLVNDLRLCLAGLRDHQEYTSHGSKMSRTMMSSHGQQRCCSQTVSSYQTKKRATMIDKSSSK